MLVKYEFLKILKRKSTLIVIAASLILTAVFFGLPVIQYQTYSREGVIRGLQGIRYEKEQYENLSVPLTNEYITENIRDVQALFDNPDNVGYDGYESFLIDDAYWNDIAPRERLLNMIAVNYADPNASAGYNTLPDLDVSDGADFYQARQDKIEKVMNASSSGLSDREKDYWRNMNSKAETPFQYGYYEGWEVLISCFELFIFPLLAISIILCPVFSGEYLSGTDAVIRSSRYGKTKLVKAKITASLLFGLAAFTLHVIVALGITFAAYGTDGWNLPLQINGTTVPYPLTFLGGTLINLGVIYLVLIAMTGLTLFLSARMKNPYFVLIIIVPVLFIPMFLSPNGTSGIYNLFVLLTPHQSLTPRFGSYVSYQFGSLVMDSFTMRAVVYIILALILLPFAGRGFKKHQVV